MDKLYPYQDIMDHLVGWDLYLSWWDVRIPYEQIISWAGILLIGYLTYWTAKFVVKNL